VAYSDSTIYTLDTTASPAGGGGVAYMDSGSFVLDTTAAVPGGGGVAYADSANFTLDTTTLTAGGGGVAFADSANFILDTSSLIPGGGGVAFSDSPSFTLNTTVGSSVWTNTAGGNWSCPTNWSPNGVPAPLSVVFLTNSGDYTVTLDVDAFVTFLALGGASGTQTLSLDGPTLTLAGPCSGNANGVVDINGGTLAGSGSLALAGPLNWSGGTISAAVQCNGGNWSGTNVLYLTGGQLTLSNPGTVNWSNPNFNTGMSSIVNNAGTINLTADINETWSGGARAFNNSGAFSASGALSLNDTFNNSGTVNLNGILPSVFGPFNNSGAVIVNSGTADFAGLYIQTGGLILLNGGAIENASPLMISGGLLAGGGIIFGSVSNSATVSPGNPFGQMIIGGDYLQTAGGALDILLGGTTSGTTFNVLTVSNTASLGGALLVTFTNGFTPAGSEVFTYLSAGALSGAFAGVSLPLNAQLTNVYSTASASLETLAASSPGNPPQLAIALTLSNCVVVSWTNANGYILQTNGDLASGAWTNYTGTVATTNGLSSITINPPTGTNFFRLINP
jgi:hypothetical protein